jgi:hypothetical protein
VDHLVPSLTHTTSACPLAVENCRRALTAKCLFTSLLLWSSPHMAQGGCQGLPQPLVRMMLSGLWTGL